MRSLTARQLLSVWEHGIGVTPVERPLALLIASDAGDRALLQHLPVGRRDTLLFDLRERTFGPDIECVASCPHCREQVELRLRVEDLRIDSLAPTISRFQLVVADRTMEIRLPDTADLAAVASAPDVDAARKALVDRCVTSPAGDLTDDDATAIAQEMARLDPQADLQLAVSCPACHHDWETGFDIGLVFWAELNAWAEHVLREVHALATAYGWSESGILRLSAWRRQLYLDMVVG